MTNDNPANDNPAESDQPRLSVNISKDVQEVILRAHIRFGWSATEATRVAFSLLHWVMETDADGKQIGVVDEQKVIPVRFPWEEN